MASIVFVLPSFAGGGAERVALTLAAGVATRGFSPSILAFSADGPLASAVPEGVPVAVLGRPRLRAAAWPLMRWLRQAAPDLVVSTLPHVNLLLGAARAALPRRTALLLRQSNMVARNGAEPGRIRRLAHRLAYRNADAVIALTAAMRAELAALASLPPDAIAVVPNPVDAARLRAEPDTGVPVRRAAVELVACGRLVPQKNTSALLRSLASLSIDWRLTVLGDGPERSALGDLARTLEVSDRVVFEGFRERPAAFFRNADALVTASLWEGMPNAALEALACGTPVIGPAGLSALEALARATPGVSLYASREDFGGLIADLVPHRPAAGRPSLLPPEYELDNAVDAFAALAEATIRRRRGVLMKAVAPPRPAG